MLNIELLYDPIILLGIYPREMRTYIHTKTYTQMFIVALFIIAKWWKHPNQCMDWQTKCDISIQQKIIHHRNKWSTDIHYNIYVPWKYYGDWKYSDTKDHILYNSIYINVQKRQIYRDRKINRLGEQMGLTMNRHKDLFGAMGNF